jgi:hypothetical protein
MRVGLLGLPPFWPERQTVKRSCSWNDATRNGDGCHDAKAAFGAKMAERKGRGSRIVERLMQVHAVHTLLQLDFVRTTLTPLVLTVATGGLGILGGIPAMYIAVGCAVTFAAITQGMLRAREYRQSSTPEHKLRFNGTIFNFDLVHVPNSRLARRASESVSRRKIPPANSQPLIRELENGQLGVELINYATFPISVFIESAESGIEGHAPPRSKYPKDKIIMFPGTPMRLTDERIPLDKLKCGRIEGNFDIKIKYGLPGKEVYELHFQAKRVDILMHENGFCGGNYTEWEPTKA